MLLLAATKIRQMKMADPSMPTAQTRGSARWVFNRHHLVAPAPVITPRKPVKHVIAPKIKLLKKKKKRKKETGVFFWSFSKKWAWSLNKLLG